MASPVNLRVGVRAPHFLEAVITPDPEDPAPPDLADVVSASMTVGGATWPAVITEAIAGRLVVRHTFALNGSDLATPGPRRAIVNYAFGAGGSSASEPFLIQANP